MSKRQVSDMDKARGYADFLKSAYGFTQDHRCAGALNLVRVPSRTPGRYVEPPLAGVSLQISRSPRRGHAKLDLGAGRIQVDLATPVFVVTPPRQVCQFDIPLDLDLMVVEFPPSFFELDRDDAVRLETLHKGARDDPLPIQLAERLWTLSGVGLNRLESDRLGHALATLLMRQVPRAPVNGLAPWQVRRVQDRLMADLAADIGLDELAQLVGLSTFHFCRAFRAATGLPPHRWRHARRMERARELLEATAQPVSEIAAAVGYDDPSRFAAAFRKALGVSPTQLRRERHS